MTCLECEESTSEGEWCEGCRTFLCTKCVGKGAAQAEGQSGSEDGHVYTWEESVQIAVREELSFTYRNRKPREVEEILCSALRRRPEIEEWIQDEKRLATVPAHRVGGDRERGQSGAVHQKERRVDSPIY